MLWLILKYDLSKEDWLLSFLSIVLLGGWGLGIGVWGKLVNRKFCWSFEDFWEVRLGELDIWVLEGGQSQA